MNVKELIKALERCDPKAEVLVKVENEWVEAWGPVTRVRKTRGRQRQIELLGDEEDS